MTADLDLSARLAHHVAAMRYEALPDSTIVSTRRALLDGFGVMLAASGLSAEVRPFIAMACSLGGTAQASIFGTGHRVAPSAAALANGAMAHALDYEDAFDAAPTHPNASLLPAALALAQAQRVSGRELITAIAVGCDLTCRLALSVGDALERSPWYPPPILGAMGAVAGAAKLLRLDARQVNDAFSLMLCQNVSPGEIKHSKHSVIRAVREAFPSQAAVTSAQLAAAGVRGFDQPFEGPGGFLRMFANGVFDARALLAQLGERFYIDDLSFKPWPCCRGTHPYIEAAQRLRADHALDWRRIRSIRAVIGPVQRMLSEPIERKQAPSTSIDAKFSIPFTVATALIAPEVTLDSFEPAQLVDRGVLSLARRVVFDYREHGATASNGALAIELADGRAVALEIPQALGHPTRPLDDARLRAKFIDCAMRAARPLSREEAEALCDRVLRVSEAQDVNDVLVDSNK